MSTALAIHGGAGNISDQRLEAMRDTYETALATALEAGKAVLNEGGRGLDAVLAAVCALEDAPCFNAGRGSVLNGDGEPEMAASVMVGATLDAGAVANLHRIEHPVLAARAMLERRHTLLCGSKAEDWLVSNDALTTQAPEWFVTDERRSQWESLRARGEIAIDHESQTVGAVARDSSGGLAAATSTGGLANQQPGRVPDTAVPGSGTWADDRTIAVSTTGDGDVFLRHGFARRVADLVELEAISPQRACDQALSELKKLGGKGGCLAVGSAGPPVLRMNTPSMFRGLLAEDGRLYVAIGKGEAWHAPGAGWAHPPG